MPLIPSPEQIAAKVIHDRRWQGKRPLVIDSVEVQRQLADAIVAEIELHYSITPHDPDATIEP